MKEEKDIKDVLTPLNLGALSATSSRRPSYISEFSFRPKLYPERPLIDFLAEPFVEPLMHSSSYPSSTRVTDNIIKWNNNFKPIHDNSNSLYQRLDIWKKNLAPIGSININMHSKTNIGIEDDLSQQMQHMNLNLDKKIWIRHDSQRHSFSCDSFDRTKAKLAVTQSQVNKSHLHSTYTAPHIPISPPSSSSPPQSSQQGNKTPHLCSQMLSQSYGLVDSYFSSFNSSKNSTSLAKEQQNKLFLVQFKRGRQDVFFVPETLNLDIKTGNLVIVDADRGRDLGKVIRDNVSSEEALQIKLKQQQEQMAVLQHSDENTPPNTSLLVPKQILRFAQPNEIQQLAAKKLDEDRALKLCNLKVTERGLNMNILNAEYQWDRRKLTFFYYSDSRIDFRDLVRELFRIYKTRIWMCAVNPNSTMNFSPSVSEMTVDADSLYDQGNIPLNIYNYYY